MPHTVNTFDVFDTLIARRSVHPRAFLGQLDVRTRRLRLASARIAADERLWNIGEPYLLADIWREVGSALSLDDATIAQLMALELDLEHEEVIPIAQNLALVKDGDLLVSDTYLPREVVFSLLRQAGLQRTVTLITSNYGKSRGTIWRQIQNQVTVREHLGDNLHSDGKTPTEAGIRAVIYVGARFTPEEERLAEHGWLSLARLVREVRLANPFPTTLPRERYLWDQTCQLNFPLLGLASVLLSQQAREQGWEHILFVSRDGLLWHQLYQRLFPQQRSHYLFTSRKCLFRPSPSYLEYFRTVWNPRAVIVDVSSTGASWTRFFNRSNLSGHSFFIVHIDNYQYLPDSPNGCERLHMTSVLRSSELSVPFSKGLEMLNYAPHPVVEDVQCLPDGTPLPVLAGKLEYEAALPEAAHRAFRECLERLSKHPDVVSGSLANVRELIKYLVVQMSLDQNLGAIYAGHQAADTVYLQHVLSEPDQPIPSEHGVRALATAT
jgi:hypothetical protein